MGTSKSQPSASGRSEAGKAWGSAAQAIKFQTNPTTALNTILKAYKGEYKDLTLGVLVDDGVKIVENRIAQLPTTQTATPENSIATFFIEARTQLAVEGKNSFFAEIALSCGAEAVVATGDQTKLEVFRSAYLSKIVEYIVARDTTKLMGSPGIVTTLSAETFLRESKTSIQRDIQGTDTLEQILRRKLQQIED